MGPGRRPRSLSDASPSDVGQSSQPVRTSPTPPTPRRFMVRLAEQTPRDRWVVLIRLPRQVTYSSYHFDSHFVRNV